MAVCNGFEKKHTSVDQIPDYLCIAKCFSHRRPVNLSGIDLQAQMWLLWSTSTSTSTSTKIYALMRAALARESNINIGGQSLTCGHVWLSWEQAYSGVFFYCRACWHIRVQYCKLFHHAHVHRCQCYWLTACLEQQQTLGWVPGLCIHMCDEAKSGLFSSMSVCSDQDYIAQSYWSHDIYSTCIPIDTHIALGPKA